MATETAPTRGRPRHKAYTYDDARRLARRLSKAQLALRELNYELQAQLDVAEALQRYDERSYAEVIAACGSHTRGSFARLLGALMPEGVKVGAAAGGKP